MTHLFEVPFILTLVSTKHSESRLRRDRMRGYAVEPIHIGEIFVLAGSAEVAGADYRFFHTSPVMKVDIENNGFVLHTLNSVYRLEPEFPNVDITKLDTSLDIELVQKVYDTCIMAHGTRPLSEAIEDMLLAEYAGTELVKDDAFVSALAARSQLCEQLFMHSMATVAMERGSRDMLN